MFISAEEMKSVLYEYQVDEITEENDDIVTEGIEAAISEVKSYFHAANKKRNGGTYSTTIQRMEALRC